MREPQIGISTKYKSFYVPKREVKARYQSSHLHLEASVHFVEQKTKSKEHHDEVCPEGNC